MKKLFRNVLIQRFGTNLATWSFLISFTLSNCVSRQFHSASMSSSVTGNTYLQWVPSIQNGKPLKATELFAFTQTPSHNNAHQQSERVCQRLKDELQIPFKAIETFELEGKLPTSSEYLKSQSAQKELEFIFHAAACFATTNDENAKSIALARATDGITTWLKTYNVSGNPINEENLIRLLQSIDLVKEALSESLLQHSKSFARQVIYKGDDFFRKISTANLDNPNAIKKDSRNWNNWQTWRLTLRAMSSALINDEAEFQKTRELIANSIPQNLPIDVPSFDFIHRDSIHYHLYNLQAWLIVAWFTPSLLTPTDMDRLETAFLFL